jgi:hypothetical protein
MLKRLDFRIQKENNLNDIEYHDERQEISNGTHNYFVVAKQGATLCEINFQNGARNEQGSVNGVLDSDLLEIVKHRLEQFQDGNFACFENKMAITKITEALMWMAKRANDRAERGVLGKHKK